MKGDEGKYAEGKTRDALKELATIKYFNYYRIPDARTLRGRGSVTPGDYFIWHKGMAYILEVKELKHEYRLPIERISQMPMMRRFMMAGCYPLLLIYLNTQKEWVILMDEKILRPLTDKSIKSYDLRGESRYTSAKAAIEEGIKAL